MAFVIKFVKGVRNHWKKSTFLALALAYGANYTKEYYQTQILMRKYCEAARKYGEQSIPVTVNPRKITVILNPNANKRKATAQFEKYCIPILNLAGICVDLLKTESEGHARTLIEKLNHTDAIIVAGGDGTVSEVITGLFRRTENDRMINPCPIGILPLGRTNTVGRILFPGGENLQTVKSLADASMAVVEETTKIVDVMKIEIIEEEKPPIIEDISEKPIYKIDELKLVTPIEKNTEVTSNLEQVEGIEETKVEVIEEVKIDEKIEEKPAEPLKPVYALASLEWGAYRDAGAKREKYWYLGSLSKYATYIFNGYKKNLSWNCTADINYLLPCDGCSNCYIKQELPKMNTRWWNRFYTKPTPKLEKDYSKITNVKCGEQHHKQIATSDLLLTTVNTIEHSNPSQLYLNLGPHFMPYTDFVSEGWKTENGENRSTMEIIQARQIEIVPINTDSQKEIFFSIDREEYEVKPIKITLLPHVLKVFCRNN